MFATAAATALAIRPRVTITNAASQGEILPETAGKIRRFERWPLPI
jgi:hypothetical protein